MFQIVLGYIILENPLPYCREPQVAVSVFCNMIHIALNAVTLGCQYFERFKVFRFIIKNIDPVFCPYPDIVCSVVKRRNIIIRPLRIQIINLYSGAVVIRSLQRNDETKNQ